MESLRLFLRSNSFRNSKKKKKNQYLRTNSNPDRINSFMFAQSNSSNTKLQSFLSTHPSSSSTVEYPCRSKPYFDLEICSGLSTPTSEHCRSHHCIAANVSESIANVHSFTVRRRRRTSWKKNYHRRISLSPTMRRTKSYRYTERLRKSSSEKITRRYSQVNSALQLD